ncbi:hypothetical protein FZEAL_3615 [Fusarium zealandicum]|uniref:N-acetyltransferase domain-containing protein n=1 Tax=Fusarium zealandicum TaxID=1053134 RepID=A0A8H4XLM1_9HYPO|nr:hypothetical protein FZEAL_3615 [Fusarium zealandicum]
MAAAEQNGIDILCDAAGSDMLLSSLFALATPVQEQNQRPQVPQQLEHHELQHPLPPSSPTKRPVQHQIYQLDPALQQQETPRRSPSTVPVKRKLSDASASSASHVCHICRRVYERADHLTRHLRSHENARPYQCSRCPKRFNRADLLTRHETTHDRDGASKDRPFIRRSDRAAEACLNCAASKAKCEDQKPCSRCRSKSLTCQMPARRGNQYRTSESQAGMSPSDSSMVASTAGNDSQVFTAGDAAYTLSQSANARQSQSIDAATGFAGSSFLGAGSVEDTPEESLYFTPTRKLFPDIELSWDLDLSDIHLPSSEMNGVKRSLRQAGDAAQDDALLRHSLWVLEPSLNAQGEASTFRFRKITSFMRDRLFAMVLARNPNTHRVPTFPSAELLSHLHETYFVQEDHRRDSFIHKTSFDPSITSPELLAAIVSSGATHISTPAVWQFGLALDEVPKNAILSRMESFDSAARDLMLLQASMIHLEIGQWSGFSRQMELSEAFAPQLLTASLRRAWCIYLHIPNPGDSPDSLDSKWRQFIVLESYKRLIIRMFLHEMQSSVGLWKSPAMAHSELGLALPTCYDLWKSNNPQEWWELHLTKRPLSASSIPRLSDVRDCMAFIDEANDWIDVELCCTVALYGLWGQIWSYRDAVRLRDYGSPSQRTHDPPTWTKALYQELYSGLIRFSNHVQEVRLFGSELLLISELFMMLLHVSLDDLQRLAGRNGEEESHRAAQLLENAWCLESGSHHAVWHAGQVLRHAQDCKATTLRGFNAMAVYFAGLALWAFGATSSSRLKNGHQGIGDDYVTVNEQETSESRAFLEVGKGTPALALAVGPRTQMEPLSNHGAALSLARHILRQNFPVTNEPMPPFVEGLCRLLADLELGLGSQMALDTLTFIKHLYRLLFLYRIAAPRLQHVAIAIAMVTKEVESPVKPKSKRPVTPNEKTPGGDLKPEDLVFERVRDERITTHYENNAQVWAAPLSTPAYLDIQHKLASTETNQKSVAYWILRMPDNPQAVVSSCATYLRGAIVTVGQGTRTTKAVVISEICTHSEYRMRGMARMLLKKLQEHIDMYFVGVEFTVLYGNGYLDMYRELGWKPLGAKQLRITLDDFKLTDPRQLSRPSDCVSLRFPEVFQFTDSDVNISKLRLSAHRDRKTHVQILPTDPLTRWHLIRSKLYSQYLSHGLTQGETCGAISQQERPAWAWWVHDYKKRQLCIGRLFVARHNDFHEVIAPLLEMAVYEAAKRGLREVVVWDSTEQIELAADTLACAHKYTMNFNVEERLEMVPCLRWKGGEEREVVMEQGQFYASS